MALAGQVLVAVLSIGTLTALTVAAVGWWNRHKPGAFWFSISSAFVGIWVVSDLVSMVAASESVTVTAAVVANLANTVAAFTLLVFVAAYLGYDVGDRRTEVAVATLHAVAITLWVGVTYWQGVFFVEYDVVSVLGYEVLSGEPGIGFFVDTLLSVLWVVLGVALLARAGLSGDGDRVWRTNVAILAAALVLPTVGAVQLVATGLPDGTPFTSALSTVALLLIAYALRREGLFELSPASERVGLQRAFEELGAGVLVVGTDGRVLRANAAACEVLERPQSALVGSDVDAVLEALEVPSLDALPADAERDGRFYQVTASRLGDGVGSTVVLQDVTERRQREQRLSVLNRVLRHNLRNGLNVVEVRTDYVAEEIDDEPLREELSVASEKAADLVTLSEKARKIEEIIEAKEETPQPCSPAEIVESIVAEFESYNPEVDVSVTVEDDRSVRSLPRLLDAVLENVVENAIVHNDGPSPTVDVLVEGKRDGVCVTVEDDGPGIPEQEVSVLEAGDETPLEHGSGLGLWLVNWSTTRLRGEVSFERTGNGTRVELWIPDLGGPTAPTSVSPAESSG